MERLRLPTRWFYDHAAFKLLRCHLDDAMERPQADPPADVLAATSDERRERVAKHLFHCLLHVAPKDVADAFVETLTRLLADDVSTPTPRGAREGAMAFIERSRWDVCGCCEGGSVAAATLVAQSSLRAACRERRACGLARLARASSRPREFVCATEHAPRDRCHDHPQASVAAEIDRVCFPAALPPQTRPSPPRANYGGARVLERGSARRTSLNGLASRFAKGNQRCCPTSLLRFFEARVSPCADSTNRAARRDCAMLSWMRCRLLPNAASAYITIATPTHARSQLRRLCASRSTSS